MTCALRWRRGAEMASCWGVALSPRQAQRDDWAQEGGVVAMAYLESIFATSAYHYQGFSRLQFTAGVLIPCAMRGRVR